MEISKFLVGFGKIIQNCQGFYLKRGPWTPLEGHICEPDKIVLTSFGVICL